MLVRATVFQKTTVQRLLWRACPGEFFVVCYTLINSMPRKTMVRTDTRTTTGVQTKTIVISAIGIGLAASLGYFGVQSQAMINQQVQGSAKYGMPGYQVPGYGVPGYGVPGYGMPGYGVP